MCKGSKHLKTTQIDLALERLELLLEPDSKVLLETLHLKQDALLPNLSRKLKKSPGKIKRQLDQLKASGVVFSSKRYPKGYSLNELKCLKLRMQTEKLAKTTRR